MKVNYQESKDGSRRSIDEIVLVKRLSKAEKERLAKLEAVEERSLEAKEASLGSSDEGE